MTEFDLAVCAFLLLALTLGSFLALRRRETLRRRLAAITLEEVQLRRLAHAAARAMLDEARRGLPYTDRGQR